MNTKINHVVRSTLTLTTAAPTQAEVVPYGATGVEIEGTGTSTPTWGFTPRLEAAFWNDNGTWKDQTTNLNQRGETSFWEADSFAASNDALYLGVDVPFRGFYVNVINVNGTSSVLTVSYWKSDETWADTSDTDNTKGAGSVTFSQDDTVTWSLPSDWIPQRLANTVGQSLYWVRLTVASTWDNDVRVGYIVPLGVQTAQAVAVKTGGIVVVPRYWFDNQAVGGIEATGDNLDTLILDWLVTQKNTGILGE